MNIKNPFDTALESQKKMPSSLRTAAIHSTDTLDLAWKAVQAVFEAKAKPEHALSLLPIFLARADAERQQQLVDARAQMEAESKQTPRRVPKKKAE
jgi:hypothetical protein